MPDHHAGLRDAALAEDIRERLELDPRLRALPLEAEVRGGVAHVTAPLLKGGDCRALYHALSRVRGVHAVWYRACDPAFRSVDLGCGSTRQVEGSLGVDAARTPAVHALADLDSGLPFRDGSIDALFAVHVLEHVRGLLGVMNEAHRVLRPSGVLHVMVPHCGHVNAFADPTHVRYFNRQTFKYFCRPPAGVFPWFPEIVSCDGASIFADLRPLAPGEAAPEAQLARYFD
ncbi:MAG: class I SAM-dependent methyltransferase [Hyphomicrobiales bacterium]